MSRPEPPMPNYLLTVQLPPIDPVDTDVVTRRVAVSTDGAAPVVTDYPAATTEITRTVAEDAVLGITLTHLDERGNESAPSALTLTVYDTTPPGQPGPMTYTLTPMTAPPPPARAVIGPSDITYLGHYEQFGSDANNGAGLTHRYVGGELRLMFLDFAGNQSPVRFQLQEFTVPAAFGGNCVAVPGRRWSDIWQGNYAGNDTHNGIWCDPVTGKLWHGGTYDYPGDTGLYSVNAVSTLTSRTLNDDGTISGYAGAYGLQGVGARAVQGGIRGTVPQWFQTQHNVGRFVAGPGGYSSRMAQGLTPSMGPFFAFLDEPTGPGQPHGSETHTIPVAGYKIGADCRSGTQAADQYGTPFASRTADRGVRGTLPFTNYLDGGDPRPNPPTPPTDPPAPGAQWLSPRPDDPAGLGRWTWTDSYFDTLNWIDTDAGDRPRHGIVMVASLCKDRAWYQSSSPANDGRVFELHVFDPAHVAECLAGTRKPFDVRPVHIVPLDLPGMGAPSVNEFRSVVGATFDPTTGRLYLLGTGASTNPGFSPPVWNRVYVFQIGGDGSGPATLGDRAEGPVTIQNVIDSESATA